MIHVIKSLRSAKNTSSTTLFNSPSQFARKSSSNSKSIRFIQAKASKEPEDTNMDKDNKDTCLDDHKTGDVMTHSFGEGYATRSDEEGFGGTYGGNQASAPDERVGIHEDHPDYDKSQGSESKEKEKGRHQTSAAA